MGALRLLMPATRKTRPHIPATPHTTLHSRPSHSFAVTLPPECEGMCCVTCLVPITFVGGCAFSGCAACQDRNRAPRGGAAEKKPFLTSPRWLGGAALLLLVGITSYIFLTFMCTIRRREVPGHPVSRRHDHPATN